MDDTFTCLSLERLLTWIKRDLEQDRIFGIHKDLFFVPKSSDPFRTNRYGRILETPVGVAAGPHTQLSQNIVSAWLTGARYIELKTVQVLDELEITKPCINMADEGYNCEWSQELKLGESLDEYANALVAILILRKRLGHQETGAGDGPGFLFNMSVGYNMEGILSPTVQDFLDGMTDASAMLGDKLDQARAVFPEAADIPVPDAISDNITLSTMHGCPPREIETIGRYFLEKRGLNTTIKLNPTLLGPDRLRHILNRTLGFEITVPDMAFDHDPKLEDGIRLIQALSDAADQAGTTFNLKLTNTLETENAGRLPENEGMVYMSGRPLHVISINLAHTLQQAFDGRLAISFSAGADCFNLPDIIACGLAPVTVCSDILKPGGYPRLGQYLDKLAQAMADAGASSIDEFMDIRAGKPGDAAAAVLANLDTYGEAVLNQDRYQKKAFPWSTIKTRRPLPAFDCIHAPCRGTCPAGQDVPAYMFHTARGEFRQAMETILVTNPFPGIQGMVCDHPCTQKCTRINYDQPLKIREVKRFLAQNHPAAYTPTPMADNGLKAAVIGGGPSGFSAAYFLRMNGFSVDVMEAKDFGGGMAADAIPSFRLDDLSIRQDIDRIVDLGVNIQYGCRVDGKMFDALRDSHDYVYIAVGASRAYELDIPGADAPGVFNQLDFLSALRRGQNPIEDLGNTGKDMVVIGGGNSAMDAARAARRLAGRDGRVTILYRRTIREMPADMEEIEDALAEGIEIREMAAPLKIQLDEAGRVAGINCAQMKLGAPDDSGRPRPEIVEGADFEVACETVITAIGQKVWVPFFPDETLDVDSETYETRLSRVYAGGDALRGASTLIRAIADGQKAARAMARDARLSGVRLPERPDAAPDPARIELRLARRLETREAEGAGSGDTGGDLINFNLASTTMTREAAMAEARRCLSCDTLCNICTTVCPNRANLSYRVAPFKAPTFKAVQKDGRVSWAENGFFTVSQAFQVVNVADFCNACGNCTSFCPSAGAPYLDKPRICLTEDSFDKATDACRIHGSRIISKTGGSKAVLVKGETIWQYEDESLTAVFSSQNFQPEQVDFKTDTDLAIDLTRARQMRFLYEALSFLA